MSYILDALKKSEQERGQGAVPGVQTVHSSSLNYHLEKRPVWPWFLGAIIAINLVAIIYFLQSKNTNDAVTNAQPAITNETTVQSKPIATIQKNSITPSTPQPAQKEIEPAERKVVQKPEPVDPIFETVDFYDLPLRVRQSIPEMKFSAHVYSSNPLQRSLVINGRFMEEGYQVNNDLTLTEITSDGAIFDFQGHRFNTSVLSGWD